MPKIKFKHRDWNMLDDAFNMHQGYVLDFSNKEFADFIEDEIDIDIYSGRYSLDGNSKANRLRCFIKKESGDVVSKLLLALWEFKVGGEAETNKDKLVEQKLYNFIGRVDKNFNSNTANTSSNKLSSRESSNSESFYNLFVSNQEDAWESETFKIDIKRCINNAEFTDPQLADRFGGLSIEQCDKLKEYPCVFAYEAHHKKDPKYGFIDEITVRQGQVKIGYTIINLATFLSHRDLVEMNFELDTNEWELNRTHWAIKKVDLRKELEAINIGVPLHTNPSDIDISKHHFDVAFSFPGGVRKLVAKVVSGLEERHGRHTCFYDNNYKSQLARPSLDLLLQNIYQTRAKLIVIFPCEEYQSKEWCGLEFRAIREIIMERQDDRIMFIRMDEGKVDGIFKNDGYIDGSTHTSEQIVDLISERINLLS